MAVNDETRAVIRETAYAVAKEVAAEMNKLHMATCPTKLQVDDMISQAKGAKRATAAIWALVVLVSSVIVWCLENLGKWASRQ